MNGNINKNVRRPLTNCVPSL